MTSSVQPVTKPTREKPKGIFTALPAAIWLAIFFVLPLLIVLIMSFMSTGRGGRAVMPLTLENYVDVFDRFISVVQRSLWIGLLTTIICLLVGYPLAFFISTRKSANMRNLSLFLIILPFWTNFLVRTYALQTILGNEGTINGFLMSIGLISQPIAFLNTPEAVIIGLVYGFLPFMVLPIYASVERFDFRYVEAAHDLGANDLKAFLRVVFPMTLPGVIAGFILVFIPAIGTFVTSDLLGGTRGLMIGNLIQQQFRNNQPLGSALSIVLMGMVMIALLIYIRYGNQENN